MKLTTKHQEAVLDAAKSIREGIALAAVHPPLDVETARMLREAAQRMVKTVRLLDEVAADIGLQLRGLPHRGD